MTSAELNELRLPAFKSIRDAVLNLGPVTLLVGRNGSGKSNITDAITVLTALATGADLRDALDGGREGPAVRGGSEGCAPFGEDFFSIGCSAQIDGQQVHLDVEVRVRPTLQIWSERLWTRRPSGPRRGEDLDLLATEPADPDSGDITARWNNEKRGLNPPVSMRTNQLLTSQVATRVPATSAAGRKVHEIAQAMLEAITSVFLLDPIPHQMREYVPAKDDRLRRNAENLSGTLNRLLNTSSTRDALLDMTQSLSEAQVSDLGTVRSDLDDVMITIHERLGEHVEPVPARLMSDGTLRFLAMAAAMLDGSGLEDAGRVLVIEELENGLHPSQAALLLGRLKEAAATQSVKTIATTHSPAILDALGGEDHRFVVVVNRDPSTGWSKATNLIDFPDYLEVIGRDSLGTNAVQDRLRPGTVDTDARVDALRALFG